MDKITVKIQPEDAGRMMMLCVRSMNDSSIPSQVYSECDYLLDDMKRLDDVELTLTTEGAIRGFARLCGTLLYNK